MAIAPKSRAVSRHSDTVFYRRAGVYNAVLGEFIARSRAVRSDPAWQTARQLPRATAAERKTRRAALAAVDNEHRFTADAAQSFASALRRSWVREHLPAQETQNLGGAGIRRGKAVASSAQGQATVQADVPGIAFAGVKRRIRRAAAENRCRRTFDRVAVGPQGS